MNTTLKNTGEIGNRRKESLIMKLKSITFVVVLGLWTAFTLAGSIWASFFFLGGPMVVVILVILSGGGLWGLGIARLMNADAKSMVQACALSWSATVFAFVIAIGFLASLLGSFSAIKILPDFPHSTHYNFLSIFVPIIGIASSINAYVVTGKLGFKELKNSAGLHTGVAAALGFLTVGLILLFGLGWEVGKSVPGKYAMPLLLQLCNIGAALAGGMALGWALEKSRIGRFLSKGAGYTPPAA